MESGRKERIESVLAAAGASGRNRLLEAEVYAILLEVGVPTPHFEILSVDGTDEEWRRGVGRLADRVETDGIVVKIQSPDILHKTEAGGIAIVENTPAEVVRASRILLEEVGRRAPSARLGSLLLCEKVSYAANLPGNEMLLALRQDPALGPVIVLGAGGLLTEWYGVLAPGETTWILSAHDPCLRADCPPELGAGGPALALLFRSSRLHPEPPVDRDRFWPILQAWADLASHSAEGIDYGHLYPVHPKEKSIDSIPCYGRISDLPETVDLAVIAVPAEGARDAIREFVEHRRAHSIILIPGGFAETGDANLAEEIIETLERGRSQPDGGPLLLGGNCLGVVSKGQYNTFFLPQYKLPFHQASGDNLVAISQSGAYLVTLTSNLDGVIFPKASISYGNQMDLTVSDFLEHYMDDPKVHVIACYVEGFQPLDGKRFVEMVREHRKRDRMVIVYKAGRTDLGAKAAASHTASLAGDYHVAESLMIHAGAVVAETLNQFEDFTKVFTMLYDRHPRGMRVGVISNAGFECSAAMDALYDLELAAFSRETRSKLAECLPTIAHADNPIDATPMANTHQFIQAVKVILKDPAVDAVVVSAVPVTPTLDNLTPDPTGSHSENIYAMSSLPQELIRVFRDSSKPLVVAIDSGRLYDDGVILLQRAGIPTYRKIDRATRALSRYCGVRMADRVD